MRPTLFPFIISLCDPNSRLNRWNRLELQDYSTVKLDTGEAEPLPLKHERPFWFSKVRSFNIVPTDGDDSGTDGE